MKGLIDQIQVEIYYWLIFFKISFCDKMFMTS